MELWRLVTRYTLKRGTDGIMEACHTLHFKKRGTDGIMEACHTLHFKKRNRWNYGGLSHVTLQKEEQMELWRLVARYTSKRGTDGIKEARHTLKRGADGIMEACHMLHFKKRNRWNYGGLSHFKKRDRWSENYNLSHELVLGGL